MASSVSDLVIRLVGKDEASPAFKKAGESAKGLSTHLGGVGKAMAGIGAAVGVTVLTKQLVDLGKASVTAFKSVAAESGSMQRVMGGTIEEVSSLRGAFKLSGIDAASAAVSMKKLSVNAVNNSEAFAAVGISVRDVSGQMRPSNAILKDTADVFAAMPAGAEKTALAVQLFGKSGTDMLPFLNRGAAGIAELEAKTAAYGLTISKVDQDNVKKFTAAQRELSMVTEGVKSSFGKALMPAVTDFEVALTKVLPPLQQALTPALITLGQVATESIGQLSENMPAVEASIGRFATNLQGAASAVRDNWPQIKETIGTVAESLQHVAEFSRGVWDAFQSLPEPIKQTLLLAAVAQKTGALQIGFKAVDIVRDLFRSTVPVMNVGTLNAATSVPGAGPSGPVGTALKFGAAAVLIGAEVTAATKLVEWSTEGLSRATSAANVYGSAVAQAGQKAGGAAVASNGLGAASLAAGTYMTEAGARALALSGAVGLAGQAAGLSKQQLEIMSAAALAVPPGASVDQLAAAIRQAGLDAGQTAEQADAMAASAYAIPATANVPALTATIAAAGAQSGMTQGQIDIMSAAVANIPPGTTAAELTARLAEAGGQAGLTDVQVQGVTTAVNGIPTQHSTDITTTAPAAIPHITDLQSAIDSLHGISVDVGVSISGSTGGGTGGGKSSYGAGKSMYDWLSGDVTALAKELAKQQSLSGVGAYAGPGGGVLGRPLSSYVVSSEYGMRNGTMHQGIDLAAPEGQGIFAPAAGLVTQAGWNDGYGNFTAIDHGGGLATHYGHQSALLVSAGQIVSAGQLIGLVGTTGDSTGPHLHFETLMGGSGYVDPRSMVAFAAGGMVPLAVSAGEAMIPRAKIKGRYGLMGALNAGLIAGPGTSTSDSIYGLGNPGDYILNARATAGYGLANIDRLLARAGGGPVSVASTGTATVAVAEGRTVVQLLIDGRAIHESLIRYRRANGGAPLGLA